LPAAIKKTDRDSKNEQCEHGKETIMKKVSLIIALILITGLIFGCSKTTPTATPTSPVSETSKAPDATSTTTSTEAPGGEKEAAKAYVMAWIEVQKDLDTLQKDWADLMASADKLDKAELKAKLEEHAKKHEELKTKVEGLKDKATTEDTKSHQAEIIEIIGLQVEREKAATDKYTKDGITPDEKTKLEATIKEKDDAAKTKLEDAGKKLEDIKTKNEIKDEGGASGGDTTTSTATPGDTGAPAGTPAASPTESK
jgi:hypothetical protein